MYSIDEQKIIDSFTKFVNVKGTNKFSEFMKQAPSNCKRFKCFDCFTVFKATDIVAGNCPICTAKVQESAIVCPLERFECGHTISSGVETCPVCDKPVCPQCHTNHDVVGISRVTGYLADISGWANGKKQELKDRKRYEIN